MTLGFSSGAQVEGQAATNRHFEIAAGYWRDLYAQDDVSARIYRDRRDLVLGLVSEIGLPAGARVLDVGCGAGSASIALAKRGYAVEAVDTVEEMIRLTKRSASSAAVAHLVAPRLGDVHGLPYPAGTFSLALALGVIPWLPSLQQPLAELARVLCRGGHLIVTSDNVLGIARLMDAAARASQAAGALLGALGLRSRGARARMYTPRQFDAAIRSARLVKRCGVTLGFGPFSFARHALLPDAAGVRLHEILQRLADRGVPVIRLLGSQYIVVARKES